MHDSLKFLTLLTFCAGENNNCTHGMYVENVKPKNDFSFCSKNSLHLRGKKIVGFNRIYFLHQNNHIQRQEKQLNCVLLTLNLILGLLTDKNNM